MGNAAFHSALLYPHLAPAIGPLVDLLSDSEEKTRANAAGALGNLVRNSSELCGQMIAAGVLDALLALVPRAREIRTRGASCGNHQDCSSPDQTWRIPTATAVASGGEDMQQTLSCIIVALGTDRSLQNRFPRA